MGEINYTSDEINLIDGIRNETNWEEMKVALLVIMSSKGYYRSKRDLASILSEYPHLDNQEELEDCIESCIDMNLLSRKTVDNLRLCYQSEVDFEQLLNSLGSNNIKDKLRRIRTSSLGKKAFKDLGSLSGIDSSGNSYVSFIRRLKGAQKEIWLPMLNTAAHNETVDVLKERAIRGVKVYILMADYKSVVNSIRVMRKSNIDAWEREMRDTRNVEIRIYKEKKYAQLASTVLIDDKILRVPIYDSFRQKSTEGHLIEFSDSSYNFNIVQWIKEELYRAWNSAVPVGLRGIRLFFYTCFRRNLIWSVIIAIILILLYIVYNSIEILSEIIQNLLVADITYIVTLFVKQEKFIKKIKKIFKAIFEKN